jgi:hypothetical protein
LGCCDGGSAQDDRAARYGDGKRGEGISTGENPHHILLLILSSMTAAA